MKQVTESNPYFDGEFKYHLLKEEVLKNLHTYFKPPQSTVWPQIYIPTTCRIYSLALYDSPEVSPLSAFSISSKFRMLSSKSDLGADETHLLLFLEHSTLSAVFVIRRPVNYGDKFSAPPPTCGDETKHRLTNLSTVTQWRKTRRHGVTGP